MTTLRTTARITGALYLGLALSGGIGFLLVRPQTGEQCEALLFGESGALEPERVSAAFASR